MKYFCLIYSLLFSAQVLALVDYDDSPSEDSVSFKVAAPVKSNSEETPAPRSAPRVMNRSSTSTSSSGNSFSLFKTLQFQTQIEAMDFATTAKDNSALEGKVNKQKVGLVVHTPYDIYLDVSYWEAKTDADTGLAAANTKGRGNPRYILGFNWYKNTSPDGSRADIYLGTVTGQKNSQFGSSRSDQIIGVETSKRISSVILGLGLEYRLTGKPKEQTERAVGDITILAGGFSWIVSNDIRFSFEAKAYKISKGEESQGLNLEKDITFSTLTPRVHLQLFPAVELELGGHFRTNKADLKDQGELEQFGAAKLTDLVGSYGNSIFAGLNFSI
ncbi:MAG: hypothetical protein JNM93_11340 [Bacteriovoracaceae bacterium]|nr:hypothetical protein [Bacteriovoracaceae bacterium]